MDQNKLTTNKGTKMTEQQLDIINTKLAEEAKNLMTDRFPTMVSYFLEDTQMYLEEIEKGASEDDPERAIAPAHTIKSSAKQLGAERVAEIAKNIEELCRNLVDSGSNDLEQFKNLAQKLKAEIDLATPELNKLCE